MPEKIIIKTPKKVEKVNEYYLKLSGRMRVLKYIVGIILVAFTVVMMLIFRESITYENMQYMLRDLSAARHDSTFSVVNFKKGGVVSAGVYRGELIALGKKNLSLYSLGGTGILDQTVNFSVPRVETSDKYFLVYDREGKGYSVYNSYSKLFSETFDYTVTDADICDSGIYAVVTSTREYPYAVYLYSKDFKRIGEYYKNKHLMDTVLSDKGDLILLLSFYASGGDFVTEVSICSTTDDFEKTVTLSGVMPISASFTDDGRIIVVTDGGVHICSLGGDKIETVSLARDILSGFCFGTNSAAVMSKKTVGDSECTVQLFDNVGKVLYNHVFKGDIIDSIISDDVLYLLYDDGVVSIDPDGGVRYGSCKSGGLSILVSDRTGTDGSARIIVCYPDSAVTVNFDDSEGKK
ncbi:MAG: hypothetical protein IKT70_06800 [Clostridia bacterium]|nr:hypothetical protein [Clostridia bacterium]